MSKTTVFKSASKSAAKTPNSMNKVRVVFYLDVDVLKDLEKMPRKEKNELVNKTLKDGLRRQKMMDFFEKFKTEPGTWSHSDAWLRKFRKKMSFRDLNV